MKSIKDELVSLNTEMSELQLQELEQRLETDPLAAGGLLDLASNASPNSDVNTLDWCLWDNECNEHS